MDWHIEWQDNARHYPSQEWFGHMDWHMVWQDNARHYPSQEWAGHTHWHMAEKNAGGFRL